MSKKRDQLVETALELFSQHGYHATGIDKILEAAGVAKMTMYKHFRSKEELILAALRLRDERWRNQFMRSVEQQAKDPRGRLMAIFDLLGQWFASADFCGCLFINASAEFGDLADPIHAASAEHKRLVMKYVRDLAEQAGAPEPGVLAEQITLLMEGAIVHTQICGHDNKACAALAAKRAAKVLIDHALAAAVR